MISTLRRDSIHIGHSLVFLVTEVFAPALPKGGSFAIALIKLRKTNEVETDVGIIFINTDQILAVTAGQSATEIQMADGRTHWVKETPAEVAALAK